MHATLKRTPGAVIEDTSKYINKNYSLIFTTAQLLETSLNQRFARPHQPCRSKHLVRSMPVLPRSHNNHSLTQHSPPIPIYAHHCEIPASSRSSIHNIPVLRLPSLPPGFLPSVLVNDKNPSLFHCGRLLPAPNSFPVCY